MGENTKEFILGYCGLVCSQCGMYLKNKCKGCHSDKPMHRHCKVKACAQKRNFGSCAECRDFPDLKRCKKLNNFVSKIFALIFRSDRIGNLNRIRENGLDAFKEVNS